MHLTPLIGRVDEIVDTRGLLTGERLVTLTGSAGVGKTRLAVAIAFQVLDQYPGGVWWVELAPLADHGAVGRAALAALGAQEVQGVAASRQIAGVLGDEPSLLVLDNCEHLIGSCADLVAGLLTANPCASVLSTSREPLRVPGEITFRVPSLGCPPIESELKLEALPRYDAVVLFADRARRARPSFRISDTNASAVADICRRLDGIPLAIELAAARCREMSAGRIATELHDRFRLLTRGARTLMARQQTLMASLDWSHELLDDAERIAFRRLGVFAGPFPLEAAEAVATASGDIEPVAVFDLVSRLVDKSLVVSIDGQRGESRYSLLESLRAYAVDRARDAGDLTVARDAHAAWWADWLEPRGTMPTDDVLDEIEEFHANLTAALNWSTHEPRLGLRLLCGVGRAWLHLGRAGDAMAAADRLLTDDNARRFGYEWLSAASNSHALYFLARGPDEHSVFLDRIEAVAERRGDQYHLAVARCQDQTTGAKATLRDRAYERGDRYLEATITIELAFELAGNEPAAASRALREADRLAAASGIRDLRNLACFAHAEAACSNGDLALTIQLAGDVLASGYCSRWADGLRMMSFAALLACDANALRLAVETGDRAQRRSPGPARWISTGRHRLQLLYGQPSTLDPDILEPVESVVLTPGTLWLVAREAIDAGAVQAAVDDARARARPVPHAQAVRAAIEAAATGNEDRWHDALALSLEQGLRLIAVDALEGLAIAATRAESWKECIRLLAAAQRLREETGYRWRFGFEERAITAARATAAAALGNAVEAANSEGRNLHWREAAAYARRARGERKRPRYGWASLTPTEHQVVTLAADGLTNPQIAERLLIGRATVKTHLEHIFTKLGVRTRSELAAQATKRTPMQS